MELQISDETITFGRASFVESPIRIIESPTTKGVMGQLTFIDQEGKGFNLKGDYDTAAIKKDIIERFKNAASLTSTEDIINYIDDKRHEHNHIYKNANTTNSFTALEKDRPLQQKTEQKSPEPAQNNKELEIAKKAGYVQGVCECVAAIGDDHVLGKKLLTEMNVTKDMAKKYANPQTFKTLEQGIFAPKPEQKLEQTQGFKR